MLPDSAQRLRATDPSESFIVQAPAGSGKTEILTQRYLRLLATVRNPEQIIALTFTRKAASEMRERIMLALTQASNQVQAKTAHQEQTLNYARTALIRSNEYQWKLLEQPSRLRIMTIDGLCQTLCQSIPLFDQQIPFATVSEKPYLEYQTASKSCFSHLLSDNQFHPLLKQLLEHLDNNQDHLLELFSDLLETRDQWLSTLYEAREHTQSDYEQMLKLIEQHELNRFKEAVPTELRNTLSKLIRELVSTDNNPTPSKRLLAEWTDFNQINRSIVISLSSILLTSQNGLRKRFDHHVGLKRELCTNELYTNLKTQSQELLTRLSETPDFLDRLLSVRNLPEPHYNPEQWEVLQALFKVLPLLVSHLHLLFKEKNLADFTAISQQAGIALGTEEDPTDLTLYLDHAIHHLLIDEFQDTSIQQFNLLSQLVHSWQPNEGKTLFIVGDPMQSIYRFRQAEVGLFLKIKREGIQSIKLISLELSSNFRSTPTLINWVNQHFSLIFPHIEDIESGAICFHSSISAQSASNDSYIKAQEYVSRQEEAEGVVQCVMGTLACYPNERIAVLVRSRKQLNHIIKTLRQYQISFQGVDIEHLAYLPHLRDLWSLTEALLKPAHRLAWLALLRSPFCGLVLSDLHLIANFDKKNSIYYALAHLNKIPLSEDGYRRAQFIFNILHHALSIRHQQTLVDWVTTTFEQLYGNKTLSDAELKDVEQFWCLLESHTKEGMLPNFKRFKTEFNQLYSQQVTPSHLQIMTIHKSKGLEFDTVILPGLSTLSQNKERAFLRWLKLPRQFGKELFLVSPVKAAYHEHDLLYNYLGQLDKEKDRYELQRLFYVAATRAKKRLYLFDYNSQDKKESFRGLIKNQPFSLTTSLAMDTSPEHTAPILYRLPSEWYLTQQHEDLELKTKPTPVEFPKQSNLARPLGVLIHEFLCFIIKENKSSLEKLPWTLVHRRLHELGLDSTEQNKALTIIQNQINQFLNDPIGQWISYPHAEAKNEYELLVTENGELNTYIIDRTFIDQERRWIIDFKTGSEQSIAQSQHQQQVNHYATLFINTPHPIHCGLYYLVSGTWLTWEYAL